MNKALSCLLTAAALSAIPVASVAVETALDATTIVRIEQRNDTGTSKQTVAPVTQFLGVDAEKLADGNLSLHLYGWGRADLADRSFNDDRIAGSLTYGYLQYRFPVANANLRAGRFFVREGIVSEQVDGASARTDLPYGFGLAAFAGAPVHTEHIFGESSDGKGNMISGGRVNYRYHGMLEIGLSGVYEGKAPTLSTHPSANHRLVGGDVWFSPYQMVELLGHTSYNTETSQIAEHSYLINLKPTQMLLVSLDYNDQHDRSYLYAWSMFSAAALNPSDQSRNEGGTASYRFNKSFEASADYHHYTRTLGKADRYGAEARLNLLENSFRSGLGYHYLKADQSFAFGGNPSASYQALRCFAMRDTTSYFAALDAIGYFYQEKIYDVSNSLEVTASLGYHLTPDLALSGDVSYGRNPEFSRETRGLIRLTYNTSFVNKGGQK